MGHFNVWESVKLQCNFTMFSTNSRLHTGTSLVAHSGTIIGSKYVYMKSALKFIVKLIYTLIVGHVSDYMDALSSQAAMRGLTYPRYAWIMYGFYPARWWTREVIDYNTKCSDEMIERFLEDARPIIIEDTPTAHDENATTDSGIVSHACIIL